MQEVITAISTCGFPIIIALLELWYIVTRTDKFTDVIAANTQAIRELSLFLTEEVTDDGK